MREEDVIKAINDFEKEEIVIKDPNVIIPYYTLDHIATELSKAKVETIEAKEHNRQLSIELKKKDKYIKDMCENYCPKLMTKDKIIDLMARAFKQDDIRSVEEIKEYFKKKAEETV